MRRIIIYLLILGFVFAFAFDAFYWEPAHPVAEFHRLKSGKYHSGFSPVRVIQISDLHLKKFSTREQRVLKIIDRLKPDIIVLTGDYIEGRFALDSFIKFLSLLPESATKIATMGNIDYIVGIDTKEFEKIFSKYNIKLLLNSDVKLKFGSLKICVIGFEDPSTGRYNLSAIQDLSPSEFNLLLAHSPEIFQLVKGRGVDLLLAGHTHGGQVRIPLIPAFWLPLDTRRYGTGFYENDGLLMYINRGIGTGYVPIRFLCRPEIAVFDILPENNRR